MTTAAKRAFLGWDGPLVDKVRDHLLAAVDSTPPDLEGNLIIVPTRHAGRRLRESLARWCDEHNTALLSAQIVTPNYLFSQGLDRANIASAVLTRSIWVKMLTNTDLSGFTGLFPKQDEEKTFQWALNTAEIVQRLREELVDGAYSISSLVEQYAEELTEEGDRWNDLASLESLYLEELSKSGFKDMCVAKMEAAGAPGLEGDIKRIVVAGVPDPSLLAVSALESAQSAGIEVSVLVHAPEDMASGIDEWGRPLADYWKEAHIDIPDWNRDVVLTAKPVSQARALLREIDESSKEYESAEIAIGVPDRAVISYIDKELSAVGLPPFDPSDALAGDHSIGQLAASVLSVMLSRSYRATSELLRNADFLKILDSKGIKSLDVLRQLDGFQNYYLPADLRGMLSKFKSNERGTNEKRDDFTILGKALQEVTSVIEIFEKNEFEDAWRAFFQEIYSERTLKPQSPRDSEFEAVALAVDAVLREFRELKDMGFEKTELSSLFVRRLGEKTYHRERGDEVIDLEGWLELPWNDRNFLIVTGMNEEYVPGGSMSEAFLPDSLRRIISLRDDASRFARDIFIMNGMVKSREKDGRACFILGKTTTAGDPLKPSRLLFRCSDDQLAGRVEMLLADVKEEQSRTWPDVIFPLDPKKADHEEAEGDPYISVTDFSKYLECPFRYYLKRELGMEESDDEKAGLDAMDFGNIVHDVMETMGRDKKLWSSKDPDKLGKHLSELAAKHVTSRFGSPPSSYVVISLVAAQERLKAAARAQVRLVEEGWSIREVETPHMRLNRGGFTIGGRIDRVDEHKDGRVRIIDYKTSDSPTVPEQAHLEKRKGEIAEYNELITDDKAFAWKDLQLALYSMLYTGGAGYDKGIELAYFGLPKALSQTGILPWVEFDSARMDSAVKCVDGVLDGISNGIFWPPAERTRYGDDFADMFIFESDRAFKTDGFSK